MTEQGPTTEEGYGGGGGETLDGIVDWRETRRPTSGVVAALAEVTGRDPTELPPLQNYVDTDALDALVDPDGGKQTSSVTVSFEIDGYHVVVGADGSVDVLS